MPEDEELEYLKRKRLLEMQKRLLTETATEKQHVHVEEPKAPSLKDALNMIFASSAWEIWQAAEQQYPQATEEVAKTLVTLNKAGKLRVKVTGEQLYWLFRQLGLRIRVETKIRILEKGELKTIADKLRKT